MKILILSNSHPYRTAGIVAKDLMDRLKEIDGNEVKLVVRVWDNYQDKNIISMDGFFKHNQKRIFRKGINGLKRLGFFRKEIIKTNRDYSVQDYDQTRTYYPTWRILKKAGFTPDVILVLFMQNFLSYKNLYELNHFSKAPIFLYMMDMAPMTGGCHYAWDCKGYLKKCGYCPAMFSNVMMDQSYINWQYKNQFIEKTDIRAIAGTEWTYRQLQKSSLFENKNKHKILLSINENIFHPADKASIRKKLSLPLNKKIIFTGAVSFAGKRKGFDQLVKALKILKKDLYTKKNIHLAIAGNSNIEFEKLLPFPYTMLGYLSHTDLPKAFQAADVFVSPSIEDAGPMMVNQSIMCGTPVVAFEIGVALDLVHNGKTGYRAKLNDYEDLANGINYILNLDDKQYNTMSKKCRDLAINISTPEAQVLIIEEIIKS
ncbi:D-inositol-3-phosphate glycosyltransferase [subsurface metagenome]